MAQSPIEDNVSTKRVSRNKINRLLYRVGMTVGGVLFISQIVKGYEAVAHNSLQLSSPGFLVLAGICGVLAIAIQVMAWARVMRLLGVSIPWPEVIRGYTLSFLPRYIPGSIWGYLSRSEWLFREHHVSRSLSHLASSIELVAIPMAGLCILMSYGFAITTWPTRVALIIVIGGIAVTIVLLKRGRCIRIPKDMLNNRIAFLRVIKPHQWLQLLVLYLCFWFCHGGAVMSIAWSIESPWFGNLYVYSVGFTLAWSIGFIALFAPSGIGVRELVLSQFLTAALGVSGANAAVMALLSRVVSIFGEVVWVTIGIGSSCLVRTRRA